VSNFFPDFVAVDLETTGLEPSKSDIIEVGATIFRNGIETDHFTSLIRPTRPLPDRISALTGLAAGELDWARSFSEVMPGFLDFLGDFPIVAHNAEFDMGFLREKLPRINRDVPANSIWDNLKLGVLLYPELQSYALEYLANFFNIPFKKTHRASEDCIITGRLFVEFLRAVPSIMTPGLWDRIINVYLKDESLQEPLLNILNHTDYNKYAKSGRVRVPKDEKPVSRIHFPDDQNPDESRDSLIKISFDDEQNPNTLFFNEKIFPNHRKHYITFPCTQYPGDFWGITKKWLEMFDRFEDLVLYPGKARLLCKRQVRLFIEEDIEDKLSLTGYEIAVLTVFSNTSAKGNFSHLSWWIWNNLKNLSYSLPFINASFCDPEDCDLAKDCYYLKALEKAKNANFLGFPYRVIKEEGKLPVELKPGEKADLTFMNPDGIFRDNLSVGIKSFLLTQNIVLIGKIFKFLSSETASKALPTAEKARTLVGVINDQVEKLISQTGNKRLQKGKRFFLFVDEDLLPQANEILLHLKTLNETCEDFLEIIKAEDSESASIISRMLKSSINELAVSLDRMSRGNLVLCLDKIEHGSPDTCHLMFFPHIYESEFLEIPPETEHVIYLTHHISDSEDWKKYLHLLGRDQQHTQFFDFSSKIPDGNRIYTAPSDNDENALSKKKLMGIKGDVISHILTKYPGRSIVIVRGSQELLNFKFRLSQKLKTSGYWPLFQKQDGPKGLLIKEFSKHQNVVFFGLTDLVSDIWQFDYPPDNLIFESLQLTSLQDPIEAHIKREMESAGDDYVSEYLEPRIHFTLTRSLNRWQRYLEGHGKIFILDERLSSTDSGVNFINQLEGDRFDI
jgi:DNA polymerase III epsilon subunit family exonuclease